VVAVTLTFDFINGFHDTANAIATVVATRVLPPAAAIFMAAALNFVGALISTEVAGTIAEGLVDVPQTRQAQAVILSAIVGAIFWQLLTWKYGIPSSSSHSLVGGLVGAVLVVGWSGGSGYAVLWNGVALKVLLPLFASPLAGFLLAWLLMGLVNGIFGSFRPGPLNRGFARLQLLTAAGMAFSHGTNDAQKSMGIITLALLVFAASGSAPSAEVPTAALAQAGVADVPAAKAEPAEKAGDGHAKKKTRVELWVILSCAAAMAFGTALGGHRIIKTMGHRIIRLEPVHGSMAETSAAAVIQVASHLGMPISTTHVISGSIFGVGAAKRLSAVRWGVAQNMIWAWVLTLPASGLVAALVYGLLRVVSVG
jgi:PiT family inorganic phosphate transporter